MKALLVIAIVITSTTRLQSQGFIVPNGVVYAGLNFAGGYEVDVLHDPTNGSYTGFFLTPQGKTPPSAPFTNTFKYDHIVDVGVRVFLVSSNQPMSLQPILAMSYTELLNPNSYVFNSGSPFYVGLYTGNVPTAPPDGIYGDPLFGWAKLVNNNGVIQMLDSALEYQGGGIIVGTQTILPVPEPSTWALMLSGAAVFAVRRWRMRRHS